MTPTSCDQSWQVEAAHDGRLDVVTRAEFEQHQAGCTVCQNQRRKFHALVHELRLLEPPVDAVTLRRVRQRTLQAANDSLMQVGKNPMRRALALTMIACAALAAVLLFRSRPSQRQVRPDAVLVQASPDARWQRSLAEDVEHVDLSAGTLLFRVARGRSERRLIVHVPDGEVEDLGTVFSVTVSDGKTAEIGVREGRVLFHRRGLPALHLVAGSRWTLASEIASPPTAPTSSLRPPPPADLSAAPVSPAPARQARKLPPDFDLGYRQDAAYLKILALLHDGHDKEAKLAAQAYLRAFPNGFRRVEVSQLVEELEAEQTLR